MNYQDTSLWKNAFLEKDDGNDSLRTGLKKEPTSNIQAHYRRDRQGVGTDSQKKSWISSSIMTSSIGWGMS